MQLQARPMVGQSLRNCHIASIKPIAIKCNAIPQRAGRIALVVQAADNTQGLTSNSSLLGPSLGSSGPALGAKSGSSAKPTVSLADVPLESKVRNPRGNLKSSRCTCDVSYINQPFTLTHLNT
jgi:hypothetical protein